MSLKHWAQAALAAAVALQSAFGSERLDPLQPKCMKRMLAQSFAESGAPHAEVLAPALEAYMGVLWSKSYKTLQSRDPWRLDDISELPTGEGRSILDLATDFVQHFWSVSDRYNPSIPDTNPDKWVYKVGQNFFRVEVAKLRSLKRNRTVSLNDLKESLLETFLDSSVPHFDDALDGHEAQIALLREALQHLPYRDRRLLQRRFFDGIPVATIADQRRVSRQAIQQKLDKIYIRLNTELLKAERRRRGLR